MKEDRIRELFREMRDEAVPPDSQARVRMAVAERARSWPERVRRYWKVGAAVLIPAGAALVFALYRPPAPVAPPPAPPVVAEKAAPIVEQAPPVVQVRRRPAKARSRRAPQAAALIRIETPDPNVVILLVGG